MKLQTYLFAAALMGLTAFSSCKKDDDNNAAPGSGNLDAGKGAISFNSSADFGGSTSYNGSNAAYTSATRTPGTGYEQVTIQTSEISGLNVRTAQLIIEVPTGASTTNGNLNADFSNQSSTDDILPILAISSTNAGSATGDGYASESGVVTITKLTATEVEGTFSGKLVNEDKGTSINVSNGNFAGKFK